MGKSTKNKSRITFEQQVQEKKKLSQKIVYVLELSFNELSIEERNNISNNVTYAKKPVPDISSVIIGMLLDPEKSFHLHDIRKSVYEYNKLTEEQKGNARNYKNIFLGKNVYILETNASMNIVDNMNNGKNRFFVKFYLDR